jgi:hypothetical protein
MGSLARFLQGMDEALMSGVRRREFVTLLGCAALMPTVARTQQRDPTH